VPACRRPLIGTQQCRLELPGKGPIKAVSGPPLEWAMSALPGEYRIEIGLGAPIVIYVERLMRLSDVPLGDSDR
jgi:hypothetical protein